MPGFPGHVSHCPLATVLFHFDFIRWTWFGSLQDWRRVGILWMRQCHPASQIPWSVHQEVWSKKDVPHVFPLFLFLPRPVSNHEIPRSAFWKSELPRHHLHDYPA